MKKLLLLISGIVVLSTTVYSQNVSSKIIAEPSLKIKKAAQSFKAKNASTGMQNGNLETWAVDSFESMSGNQIVFQHPDMWAPVNGFMFSFFFGIPIPIESEIDLISNNTSAKIYIDTMNFGSDLATIFSTSERIVSLSGDFQYNGTPGDAGFEIYATKYNELADSSEIVGMGAFTATTTNGSFQSFSTTLQYMDETVIPDSIYVFASYIQGQTGTWFKFDNLSVSNATTGISKELSSKVSVFPNPSSDKIMIKHLDAFTTDRVDVSISKIDGSKMFQKSSFDIQNAIDISSLPVGIYILSINDGQHIITKKISKI